MTTEEVALTPRQQEVLNLLRKGRTRSEIAKRMKVTPANVSQHMRKMREAGVTLPNGAAPSQEAETTAQNGSPLTPISAEVEATVLGAIEHGEQRLKFIDEKVASIGDEIASLQNSVLSYEQERTFVHEQLKRYQAASSALKD